MVWVSGACLPLADKLPLLSVAQAVGELSRAEDGRIVETALAGAAPPGREGPVIARGVERPHVEVLDTVRLVHVVQRCAPAQGTAQKPTGVAARAVRVAGGQIRLNISGDLGKTVQVGYLDPCH